MSTYLKVKDQANLRITNKLDFTGSRKVDGSKQRPNHLAANVILMTIGSALRINIRSRTLITMMTMVVMTTSFWRRDMAILLETLRPIDGSGLVVIKVIAGEGNTVTMMTIEIKPSGATEATEKKGQADNGKNLRS